MTSHRPHVTLSLVSGADCHGISDGDLARALIAGDVWATEATWNRFSPMVYAMAIRALGCESEAEDMVQEVFFRLFLRAKTLRDPDSLRSFVVSFAIRILKWQLRRKRARAWLSFSEPQAYVDLASESLDMESRDLLRRFYTLLDRLGPRDRLVFSLRRLESMTVEEVAQVMELSVSTVKRSLDHGIQKLERWIKDDPSMASLLNGKGWKR